LEQIFSQQNKNKPFTKRYFGFGNNNGNANHLQKRYFGFGNKFRNKKQNRIDSQIQLKPEKKTERGSSAMQNNPESIRAE